jgi:hypothetical protein
MLLRFQHNDRRNRFPNRKRTRQSGGSIMGKQPTKVQEDHDNIVDDNEDIVVEEEVSVQSFSDEDIHEAIDEAFEEQDYFPEPGKKKSRARHDWSPVALAIYDPIAKAVVKAKKDRAKNAVTRGELMDTAFPNVPGANDWDSQDDPAFAEAVYKKISDGVWALTSPEPDKPMQRLVGVNTPDMTLCRCKIVKPPSKDAVDAVYITDDQDCLDADYYGPDEVKLFNMAKKIGKKLSMVMARQPDYADHFDRQFKKSFNQALGKGRTEMRAALEAAHADDEDTDTNE